MDSKVTYINCSNRPPGGEQQTVSTRMTPVPVFGDRNEGWRGGGTVPPPFQEARKAGCEKVKPRPGAEPRDSV